MGLKKQEASPFLARYNLAQNMKVSAGVVLLVFFYAFTLLFYIELAGKPFSLDDPTYLLNAEKSSSSSNIQNIFGSTLANRFRPVSDIAQFLSFRVAGENPYVWWLINCALIALTAFLLTYAVNENFSNRLFGVAAGLSFLTSRFLQYNASQVVGVMESTNNILFALILIFIQKHSKTSNLKYLYGAVAFFTLICFSHERFQTIFAALAMYIALLSFQRKRTKYSLLLMLAAPLCVLAWIKSAMHFPQIVGTGSVTELGFRWDTTFIHTCEGLLQVFGINFGPGYLVGVSYEFAPLWLQSLGAIVFVSAAIFCAKYIGKLRGRVAKNDLNRIDLYWPVLFLFALLPGLVTIRLEQRWLAAPMLVIIFVFSKALNERERLLRISARIFLVGYLAMNFFYVSNSSSIFFRGTQDYAIRLLSTLDSAWLESSKLSSSIILISKNDPKGLAENFERIMLANTRTNSHILGYSSLDEANATNESSSDFIFEYDVHNGNLIPITDTIERRSL